MYSLLKVDYNGCVIGNFNCLGSYKNLDGDIVLKLKCTKCGESLKKVVVVDKIAEGLGSMPDIIHIICSKCKLDSYMLKIPGTNETFSITGKEYRRLDRQYRNYRASGKISQTTDKIKYIYEMRGVTK